MATRVTSQPGFSEARVTGQRGEGWPWSKPTPAWRCGLFLACSPRWNNS